MAPFRPEARILRRPPEVLRQKRPVLARPNLTSSGHDLGYLAALVRRRFWRSPFEAEVHCGMVPCGERQERTSTATGWVGVGGVLELDPAPPRCGLG